MKKSIVLIPTLIVGGTLLTGCGNTANNAVNENVVQTEATENKTSEEVASSSDEHGEAVSEENKNESTDAQDHEENNEENAQSHEENNETVDRQSNDNVTSEMEPEADVPSDEEIENIINDNYSYWSELFLENESEYMNLLGKYQGTIDVMGYANDGVDIDSAYYEDAYNITYPKAVDRLKYTGMEAVINSLYVTSLNPRNPTFDNLSLYDVEVLEKDSTSFKVKQTRQSESSGADDYIVSFVFENGNWLLEYAERLD